jgi:DNA-binding PadR family transcriptional regulator
MATATDPLAATGEQSPLRGGLLALLVQGPSYGYELANRLERQLGPDWGIVRSSLYRTLKAMCAEGLLSAEKSEAGEARIVYSATGRADGAVQSWMESPLSLEDGQLQLQVRMIVARLEDLPRLVVAVNNHERSLFVAHVALKDGIVNAGSLRGAMMRLVREASRHRIEAELSWLVEARNTILGLMAS